MGYGIKLVVGIVIFLVLSVFLHIYTPELEIEEPSVQEDEIIQNEYTLPSAETFYTNPKVYEFPTWTSRPMHYTILNKEVCKNNKKIAEAFRIISQETDGLVWFQESDTGNVISIECEDAFTFPESDLETIRHGEASSIIYPDTKEIVGGNIKFFNINCLQWECSNYPETEIHEILHVLGFGHINSEESIMNPIGGNNVRRIDFKISSCLKRIYGGNESYSCEGISFLT